MAKDNNEIPQLDWVQLQNDLESRYKVEGVLDRIKRKTNENPFVPIGCLATILALGFGLYNFRTGNQKMSQYMMRTRVIAQGLTIIAVVTGMGIAAAAEAKRKSPE